MKCAKKLSSIVFDTANESVELSRECCSTCCIDRFTKSTVRNRLHTREPCTCFIDRFVCENCRFSAKFRTDDM